MITERVSITKTPPIKINKNSNFPKTAKVPNNPPIANDPVSPIKTSAFGLLNFKNPNKAPATAAEITASSVSPNANEISAHAKNAGTPHPAANPSNPSVKLYALEAPVIINPAKNGQNHFKSKI